MSASDLRLLAAALLFCGLTACAEGKEPPLSTQMVRVTADLTFEFGEPEPCFVGDEQADICALQVTSLIDAWYPTIEVSVEPFSIDAHEVTNVQYEFCVAMERCTEPDADQALASDQQDYYENSVFHGHPVIRVSWAQASEYCAFAGKRLPTEVEWERAAKGGGTARLYAADGVESMATCQIKELPTDTCSSQSTEASDTSGAQDFVDEGGDKIFHLFGNVAEWTADAYEADLTCEAPGPCTPGDAGCFSVCADEVTGDLGTGRCIARGAVSASELRRLDGDDRVVRGGSVADQESAGCNSRTGTRRGVLATDQRAWLGFRCARSL